MLDKYEQNLYMTDWTTRFPDKYDSRSISLRYEYETMMNMNGRSILTDQNKDGK